MLIFFIYIFFFFGGGYFVNTSQLLFALHIVWNLLVDLKIL